METENLLTEEQVLQELEAKREFVLGLEPEEIVERLERALFETDVVLEGYNLVNNIAVGDGIALAGILKLREAVSEVMDWMVDKLLDDETIIDTEENDEL